MKKLVVAALVLGLAGVAAAGWHVQRSLSAGVCPLTGEPMECGTYRCTSGDGASASSGVVSGQQECADAAECAEEKPSCCPKRAACEEKAAEPQQAAAPAAAPAANQ